MKKLNIHVINKYFYPVTAGIETNLTEVYGRLATKGHSVTVHTSRNTLSKQNALKKNETIGGIRVVRYDYEQYGFIPKLPKNVDSISLHNFTITPNLFVMFWVAFLKFVGRKKFTLMLSPQSGFNPDWGSIAKKKVLMKRIFHNTVGRFLINYTSDGVRAISQWEKDEMIKSGIKKDLIELIRNGTQAEAFQDNEKKVSAAFKKTIKSAMPYVVQIGRIHPIKNYETSIEVFKKISGIKLLIIGSVENKKYFAELNRLIKIYKLGGRIIFLSGLTEAEKYFALSHAEAMLHLSRHEGYCIAVHEGMSQGLVCIVSNTTALPELIADGVNGYCLDPDDVNGITRKLTYVLNNKASKTIKAIEKNNVDFARNTTWEQIADKVEAFYLKTFIDKVSS